MWRKIIFDGCETLYSISEQGEVRKGFIWKFIG